LARLKARPDTNLSTFRREIPARNRCLRWYMA
jgi:hypothetical protein